MRWVVGKNEVGRSGVRVGGGGIREWKGMASWLVGEDQACDGMEWGRSGNEAL